MVTYLTDALQESEVLWQALISYLCLLNIFMEKNEKYQ